MFKTTLRRRRVRLLSLFLVLATLLALPISGWGADDRQLTSGPFSVSMRGGMVNNSAALGVDGRVDYLTRNINLHLFGTFDWLDAGNGEGEISNTRYGGGFALSHTYGRLANVFAGMSMLREMDENLGHAYFGGKLKLTDYALLSAAYGFGFGAAKETQKYASTFVSVEAVDWLKVGGVLVSGQGMKANVYYHLTDPANERISGVDGELSYALLNNLTVGANGSYDITNHTNQERNWRTSLFVTYAFGSQKGSPIDIALDKNNPTEYPQVIRKVVLKPVVSSPTQTPASPLTLSSAYLDFCALQQQQRYPYFVSVTASGGTMPYRWEVTEGSLTQDGPATVVWTTVNTFSGPGPIITVYDANNNSKSVTITGYDLCPW
jgi:hypothetical protein